MPELMSHDEHLAYLYERALAVLREAESTGSLRLALAAIATARQTLELRARLSGELGDATVNIQNVAILQTREWLDVRERLLRALQPYPEARAAAAAALTAGGDSLAVTAGEAYADPQ